MARTEAQKRYAKTPKGKAAKKAADARHYERHGDEIKARVTANFHALSAEEKLARGRAGKARDPEGTKRRRNDETARLRLEVILAYGGECACCGADYLPHLTLDHIDGGGSAERKALGGGRNVYRRLRREGFPEGYQILCWNCNSAKYHLGRCGCQDAVAVEVGGGDA